MKVYITGISGMLGANIAYTLKDKYEIYGTDLIEIHMDKVKSERLNLSDSEAVEESIGKILPDIVVHTAAAVNVELCEKDPQYAEQLNYMVTKNLVHICEKKQIRFIYISTDAVFDGEQSELYKEEDLVNPVNVYGLTKLKGEQAVLDYKLGTVLRTNIYGFNFQDKASFGEWILYSLLNNETLNMFTDIYFSPILVNELAEIIDRVIEKDVRGLYHACASGKISKYKFAVLLKEIFHINSGKIVETLSKDFEFKAKRSPDMGMSNEKLKKELNLEISDPEGSLKKFKELYDEGFYKLLKTMR